MGGRNSRAAVKPIAGKAPSPAEALNCDVMISAHACDDDKGIRLAKVGTRRWNPQIWITWTHLTPLHSLTHGQFLRQKKLNVFFDESKESGDAGKAIVNCKVESNNILSCLLIQASFCVAFMGYRDRGHW